MLSVATNVWIQLQNAAYKFPQTRSLAQKSAYKDLRRNGQNRAITPKATYTPTSKRASSRS
ncbi:hypothetical protein DB330_05120 [Lacticaseibacillus casei]|nr:hypothetical protein [Lacticaseibacillus casei]PTU96978.1 hypothetical protein DB330_05120 [Lacticaseibacillus casei]PTU98981.1 hypothetical protein DB326_05075 [Lacticaseibacillus casei]RXS57713.1 hypothetical protein ETB94_05005 [Lacticaseibacillus casei]TLF34936.1 hypothetical protein FEI10_05140 [Lacticaseibacillus casei]